MNKKTKCPRCKRMYRGYPALSRRDNETEICSDCGVAEALSDYILNKGGTRTKRTPTQQVSDMSFNSNVG